MQYYLDMVPWYVWLLPTPIIIGALIWFAGPVLIPLWRALPEKVRWIIVFAGTVGIAFLIGRSKGNQTARDRQAQLDAQAEQNRREIHNDIQNRPEPVVDRDLGKWMRDR